MVLASGGCAFLSRALGTNVNTGDGAPMAAEVGADLSGMEFSDAYGLVPAGSTVTKTAYYGYATGFDRLLEAMETDLIGVESLVMQLNVICLQIQTVRFGLAWPGGQHDAPVAALGDVALQICEHPAGQPATSVGRRCPDPFEFGGVGVDALVGAAGDRDPVGEHHEECAIGISEAADRVFRQFREPIARGAPVAMAVFDRELGQHRPGGLVVLPHPGQLARTRCRSSRNSRTAHRESTIDGIAMASANIDHRQRRRRLRMGGGRSHDQMVNRHQLGEK